MTVATAATPFSGPGRIARLWTWRQLRSYPNTIPRLGYLAVVVLTTIVLYYLYYVEGAVTPLLLPYYHMSFTVLPLPTRRFQRHRRVSAFIGGLSDKIGRANLTIYGTLIVGLIQLVGIPHIHTEFGFAAAYCVIGFVEGVILVSTPALMRDFSPQMGRGAAMGFWALGPTMGSLAASLVATHTSLTSIHFKTKFVISGLVCIGVSVISLFFLRELSPGLRDQIMVSENGPRYGRGPCHRDRQGSGHGSPNEIHDAARPDLVVFGDLTSPALLLRFGQRPHPLLGCRLRPLDL